MLRVSSAATSTCPCSGSAGGSGWSPSGCQQQGRLHCAKAHVYQPFIPKCFAESLVNSSNTLLLYDQVVLEEVAGRQVAVNNRAGRSNGQVETLLGHVDTMLAGNGNTLFKPTEQPAAVIQPERYFTQC